jgi:hypothetical protein
MRMTKKKRKTQRKRKTTRRKKSLVKVAKFIVKIVRKPKTNVIVETGSLCLTRLRTRKKTKLNKERSYADINRGIRNTELDQNEGQVSLGIG